MPDHPMQTLAVPGVWVHEAPAGPPPIAALPTAVTAFVGRAWKGPLDQPVRCTSLAEAQRVFGGVWPGSRLAQALGLFFANGGREALVLRTAQRHGAAAATPARLVLGGGTTLVAVSPGSWGRNLVLRITHPVPEDALPSDEAWPLFDLQVVDDPARRQDSVGLGGSGAQEQFAGLSLQPGHPRHLGQVLARHSALLRLQSAGTRRPPAGAVPADAGSGTDGCVVADAQGAADELAGQPSPPTGLQALQQGPAFNLLVLPPLVFCMPGGATGPTWQQADVPVPLWAQAAALCQSRQALLLVDAPAAWTARSAVAGVQAFHDPAHGLAVQQAALYHPWLRCSRAGPAPAGASEPADAVELLAPCAAVAGLMARTDAQQGVWRAPAGTGAVLHGVLGLAEALDDAGQAPLNQAGINVLRPAPAAGGLPRVWGARTLAGADGLASEWRYLNVRRLALHVQHSVRAGTGWAVFEPNGPALWQRLQAAVDDFLAGLFRAGALAGSSPQAAWFVRCGADTTPADDLLAHRVLIQIGLAPLKAGEFVVLRVLVQAGEGAA